MIVDTLFWLAALAVGYTWVGYPVLVTALGRWRRPPAPSRRRLPRLTVIVAAYNEARCIAAKLRSTLRQRYPWDRLEVIVVSDGSTDATDEIVAHYPDVRVRLLRQDTRSGKSLALNRAVAASSGDVLVFTDANALFGPEALARLAAPFEDPRVSLVSGQGLYASSAAADAQAVSNGYVRFEELVKSGEAGLGFLAGADGAIYALRRDVYRDLASAQVNDLLHPIQVALAGGLCRFDGAAYTMEPPSKGGTQEFRRHVRIIAQGIHIVREWLPRLIAAGQWRAAFMLVSHRALRWNTAVFLGTALVTNAALAAESTIYALTMAGQIGFYALALAGYLAERGGRSIGRLALPYYFCVVSVAGVGGVLRFLTSGAESVWAPTGQPAVTERAA
ncbi:MAG: glycosyltransferase [Candidatus Rokubacteria bacterium]|nr:glycosyltransferase [Candidatus Rokubacteria bacterium]